MSVSNLAMLTQYRMPTRKSAGTIMTLAEKRDSCEMRDILISLNGMRIDARFAENEAK